MNPFTVTPAAAEYVQRSLAEEGDPGDCLRVTVYELSGPQYRIDFDVPKADDVVLRLGALTVLLDPESEQKLLGVTMDYKVAGLCFRRDHHTSSE